MRPTFINEAFLKAVSDYQQSKDVPEGILFNSFLTVCIRALVCIYNELDIINPLMTENEEALKENLAKFGYSQAKLEEFFQDMECFYKIELENEKLDIKKPNPFFISIQKKLIDMLMFKKVNFHLTEKEIAEFYDLLYTPYTSNELRFSYNFLTAPDVLEVHNYFQKQMAENIKIVAPEQKHFLNFRAYEILNYSMDNINEMSSEELEKVNHQVYDYFKIRENAINKEYLLEKAVDLFDHKKNKLTSGNGYVDILLIMGVICTTIMMISIVAFIIL